jgi:hypothetical protein
VETVLGYVDSIILRDTVSKLSSKLRNSYNIWMGNLEGKRPLGRPRHRPSWEDINIDFTG